MKRFFTRALRWLLVLILIGGLAAGGQALILRKKQSLAQAPRFKAPATIVEAATVQTGSLDESHDYLAVIEPIQSANITAQVTETIETVMVDEGDVVVPGQSLILLDRRQVDTQIAAIESQIKQAQADLQGNKATTASLEKSLAYWVREAERDTQLAQNETIPASLAEATVEKKNDAEGKLAAARQRSAAIEQQIQALESRRAEWQTILSYHEIRSPFAGVVTARLVDPGDQAAPGKTLLVIESAGALMIAFDVPQTDLPWVRPGLTVSYSVGGETRKATIGRLYPSLNRARMVRAEVMLDQEQAKELTSGAYLTVTVTFQQYRDVPLIPVDALIERSHQQDAQVFVVQDGILKVREVQVLGTSGELAAVQGLQPGEVAVRHSFLGWARLADGIQVKIR